jgi:hypothetical protein
MIFNRGIIRDYQREETMATREERLATTQAVYEAWVEQTDSVDVTDEASGLAGEVTDESELLDALIVADPTLVE